MIRHIALATAVILASMSAKDAYALDWVDAQAFTDLSVTIGVKDASIVSTLRYSSPNSWSLLAGPSFDLGESGIWLSPKIGVRTFDEWSGLGGLWLGSTFCKGVFSFVSENTISIGEESYYEAFHGFDFHPLALMDEPPAIDLNAGVRFEQVNELFWLGGQVGAAYEFLYAELAYIAGPQDEVNTHTLRFSLMANLKF